MNNYYYHIVDVFTDEPLTGNALAVFPNASGMDSATMQKIAKELNLSETSFVFPPVNSGCAAKVRIFTPDKEMEFAGHPTIGTAYVLLKHGVVKSDNNCFLLEENVGAVPVKVDSGENPLIWLETPEIEHGNTFEREICTEVLGLESDDLLDIEPQLLSAGNPTLFVALRGTDAVDRAKLDLQGSSILRRDRSEPFCVFVFTAAPNGAYARMFAPEYGISEDPATGSSAGPLAVYMLKHNLLSESASTSFICEQGVKMGRRSTLHIRVSGDVIEVGGSVVAVGRGELLKQHPVDQHP